MNGGTPTTRYRSVNHVSCKMKHGYTVRILHGIDRYAIMYRAALVSFSLTKHGLNGIANSVLTDENAFVG